MATDTERKSVATPEQIAAFDELLAGLNALEAAAVHKVWKAAQGFGYRTAANRVWSQLGTVTVTETVEAPQKAA